MRCYSKLSDWWYDQTKKYKILDWIDDNIIFYVWDKPYELYRSIRHWFYCNTNKEHYNLVKTAFNSYGWDFSFLLLLEEAQIDKQLKWFNNHQMMVDDQYNKLMWSLRIAKHCIYIMNNDSVLYHYDGEIRFRDVENDDSGLGLTEADTSELIYHYDGPYVNHRNAHRFLNKHTMETEMYKSGELDSELYLQKAKHLYYKIRLQYTELWWD